MKVIESKHYFVVSVLFALVCGLLGFYAGEKKGIGKGAKVAAGIAMMNLDAQKDLLVLVESCMDDGSPNEAEVRELMASALEAYIPSRALFSAEPFGQKYDRFESDQEEISGAMKRLKERSATIAYD